MVADALDVLGDEQEMRRRRDVARVFHHVGQQLAEQAGIDLVQLLVAVPHLDRLLDIARDIRIEHVSGHVARDRAHPRDLEDRPDRRHLRQRDRALGDVGRIVGDPFDVAGDAQRADDAAQVARHRLAQGQHADGLVVDLALDRIDLLVRLDDVRGQLGVALDDRLDRVGDLAFRQAAHAGDHVGQPLQLFVEGLDDVFVRHALNLSRPPLSRTGR